MTSVSPWRLHAAAVGYGNGGKQFRSRAISQKCSALALLLSSPVRNRTMAERESTASGYIPAMAY